MNQIDFQATFKKLTGFEPHAWQEELASDAGVNNRLIRIPTGMGKTLGVLSAWIHHRIACQNQEWPTRLVWCLPMRTLVEQTVGEAKKILDAMSLNDEVRVHPLMSGAVRQSTVVHKRCKGKQYG